jgi:uncharacterized Zn-finger protein
VYLDCGQCDKKFYDRDHLNKHLATHSGKIRPSKIIVTLPIN